MFRPTALFFIALMLAPAALAQSEDLVARLDQDGDGVVSRDEFQRLREAIFARMDSDGSGTLSVAEVAEAEAAAAERRRKSRDLWSQDVDKDGQLTLTEFTAKTPGFDRADRDGDGALSAEELDRVAQLLNTLAGRN